MFELYADKVQLNVQEAETVTSGSVNAYQVQFRFSDDWAGLERAAVFMSDCGETRSVLLDSRGVCNIPWEVLAKPGYYLFAGVYGCRGEETVLPTVWVNLGLIQPGAEPGEESKPPTPELWEQALARKGDRLGYTGSGDLGLWSGDNLLSAVPVEGGGGEGGTTDHRRLSHRNAEDQHPIEAISGLDEIPNRRVLEIWNGVMSNE